MPLLYPYFPDFSDRKFLVTGGAGFIGSHVVDFLLHAKAQVLVMDNLSTGKYSNIRHHEGKDNFKFVEADITNFADCVNHSKGIDVIIHLAALGSVPRSVANPIATHEANSSGFLNMLWAAKENGVKKLIFASSSSVYGDNITSPKREGNEGKPLSPYACTKQNNEAYASLFYDLYELETIGLRFFNIFGPRQNKDGPYAAFIPIVLSCAKENTAMTIYGDGLQSRDFTFVANAVWAISCSVLADKKAAGKAFNVGCGETVTLLDVIAMVKKVSGSDIKTIFNQERKGDVKNSLADLTRSELLLDYKTLYNIKEGLKLTFENL